VWTCWVDAWGLQSGQGAAEYILTCAISKLSDDVDCLALAGLPANYQSALAGGATWAKTLAGLFSRR